MPQYNVDAARARISEYEGRAELEERRGPTQPYEFKEQEGWATRLKAKKAQMPKQWCGLTNDQLLKLRHTHISAEQLRFHETNEIRVTKDEMTVDQDGKEVVVYWRHGLKECWDEEKFKEIIEHLTTGTEKFRSHYPPGPPKHQDKRFKDSYEEDKSRCQSQGYEVGNHHLGFRR
jgi:hypothetical protein